jgi:hypothetical protein
MIIRDGFHSGGHCRNGRCVLVRRMMTVIVMMMMTTTTVIRITVVTIIIQRLLLVIGFIHDYQRYRRDGW